MQIRDATEADLPEIQAIYAGHVLTGTGTLEERPPSIEEMARRHARIVGRGWRWIVAVDATGVLGYAHYSQLDDHCRHAAEDNIYVRDDVRGQGVGKALVGVLIDAARSAGFRQMVAVIGDAENVGSIGVHTTLGFHRVGSLRAVGFKFGRWLDIVYMQRSLGEGDASMPATD